MPAIPPGQLNRFLRFFASEHVGRSTESARQVWLFWGAIVRRAVRLRERRVTLIIRKSPKTSLRPRKITPPAPQKP